MRTLLNLLIMAFVVAAIWYQVKTSDFPAVQTYLKGTTSEFNELKNSIPDSFKNIFAPLSGITSGTNLNSLTNLNSFGDVNLNTLTNIVKQPSTSKSIPIPKLPTSLPAAIKNIIPSITTQANPLQQQAPVVSTTAAGNLTVEGIISQTNVQRKSQGSQILTESVQLDASAQAKANDLLAKQYFAHVAPDGKTVTDLVGKEGYEYIKIGENLALGTFNGDAGVVTAWMNSPEHRENMLDTAFTQIGVGVSSGMYQGRVVTIAVQHFGRPRSACPTINTSLKTQVENGQTELNTMSDSLVATKTKIDAGEAAGNDETSDITLYNAGVEKYKSEYAAIELLRQKYNDEVNAFNSCVNS